MDHSLETLARQREARVRRTVAHRVPGAAEPHPFRRRTARGLRRIADAIDLG